MNANLNTEMSEIHGTKCLARWLTSVILAFAIVVGWSGTADARYSIGGGGVKHCSRAYNKCMDACPGSGPIMGGCVNRCQLSRNTCEKETKPATVQQPKLPPQSQTRGPRQCRGDGNTASCPKARNGSSRHCQADADEAMIGLQLVARRAWHATSEIIKPSRPAEQFAQHKRGSIANR